jgi:hypothetical protein
MAKLIVAFPDFENAPKKKEKLFQLLKAACSNRYVATNTL